MAQWLSAADVWHSLQEAEIHLIDIRPPEQFCQGHPLAALCVPFSQQRLAERVEIAAGSRRPIVLLLASQDSSLEEAESQLIDDGWSCLGAVLDDPPAWSAAGAQWATIPELPIDSLDRGHREPELLVLDVREPLEWETGHVPGALLISLGNLLREQGRIPNDGHITVICEAGLRSATAASMLQSAGYSNVSHLPEGTAGYRKSGRPLEFSGTEQEQIT